uniref:Uncharacterized protein n=1 Tax=Oryza sativa subsp. japonica TaxID=39947 RepID=Q2QWS3_ORYSJ|nr:hypothetical protein LOC_Os12g08390 [Oryza sativa Japonica Group]
MATVTQAPGLSTPSMLGNPDGGAPAATMIQSAPCATGGEALVGEGRLRKGKMVAEDQSPPSVSGGAPADLPPGGDKLTENGGDTDTLLLGARCSWIERMCHIVAT